MEKQSSHFLVAFLILTTISNITCIDVLPSLFGRTVSGTITITSFFDPISQISAISSRFIFFSNASGGKAIVTLGSLDPSFLIGVGSFVIGNSSNPIELQTSVDFKVLSNGVRSIITTNGTLTTQTNFAIASRFSNISVEGGGMLDIRGSLRCEDILPASVNIFNGGSLISSARNETTTTSIGFEKLRMNINSAFFVVGQSNFSLVDITVTNNSQFIIELYNPIVNFFGSFSNIYVDRSSFTIIKKTSSPSVPSLNLNINLTLAQGSNFTISKVYVNIISPLIVTSGSIMWVTDGQLTISQSILLDGDIYISENSSFTVLPNARITGSGSIYNSGYTNILGFIGNQVRVTTNFVTGTTNFAFVEFTEITEIIDAYVTLEYATIDGTFNVNNGTFVGSNIDISSLIQVNYADININQGKFQLENIDLLLSQFDSWMTFQEGTFGKFINSTITIVQGFINFSPLTHLEMSGNSALIISTNGHLRVGSRSRIIGNVVNEAGTFGAQWDSSTKDGVVDVEIDGSFTQTNGELVLRIAGYAEDKKNSLLYVDSADLAGTITLLNDEGLALNQSFTIMQLNSDEGQILIQPNLLIKTTYREDFPVKLRVEGKKLIAYTESKKSNSSCKHSFSLLISLSLLLFIVL